MGELLVKFGVGEDMDPGCQGVQWISELGLEGTLVECANAR